MANFNKIDGTTQSLFALDAAGNTVRTAIKGNAGFLEARLQDDSDFAPLRVKDDADADSCMTRAAIEALPGAASPASVQWFMVPFAFGSTSGDKDFTSSATLPDPAYVTECRVLVTTPYNNGPNVLTSGHSGAAGTEFITAGSVDLQTAGIYEIPQIQLVSGGGAVNIHVRVNEPAGASAGGGGVWIGYMTAPKG